jgi:hypothetical protein
MKTSKNIFMLMMVGILCACMDPNAAQKYATAQAGETAIAQLTQAGADDVARVTEISGEPIAGNTLPYGPVDGEIEHKVGWFHGPDIPLKDFAAGANFYNPAAAQGSFWEYGFAFRGQDGIWMYLILDSDAAWSLVCMTADISTPVGYGEVANINLGAGESNAVVVGAQGSQGALYVNQQRIAALDLSCSAGNAGKVSLTSGWASGAPIPNGVTPFAQFSLREFSDLATLVNALQPLAAVRQPEKNPTPRTNGYLYGPVDGEIDHPTAFHYTDINLLNFYTAVTFQNPAGGAGTGWLQGVYFRDNGNKWMYLRFTNTAEWALYCMDKEGSEKVNSGQFNNMNTGANQTNSLLLVARDSGGELIFNDEWVSDLDLSCTTQPGEIYLIATWRPAGAGPGVSYFSNFYISDDFDKLGNLQPTNTPKPPSVSGPPMVSVSQNTNCRAGPSVAYDHRYDMLVGKTAEVVGRSADGEYWVINRPDGRGQCWLWDEYATVTGDTSKIPVMTPPATPTPKPNITIAPDCWFQEEMEFKPGDTRTLYCYDLDPKEKYRLAWSQFDAGTFIKFCNIPELWNTPKLVWHDQDDGTKIATYEVTFTCKPPDGGWPLGIPKIVLQDTNDDNVWFHDWAIVVP